MNSQPHRTGRDETLWARARLDLVPAAIRGVFAGFRGDHLDSALDSETRSKMSRQLLGIHHITAIAGAPNRNIDFYTRVLGLRLVKLTVNFDDPGSYHLYYGDGHGNPGTILTFISWPGAARPYRQQPA